MSKQPTDRDRFWYMPVEISETGSVTPKLNPEWEALRKLAWKAGLVQAKTGLKARVGEASYTINGVKMGGYFDVLIGRTVHAAYTYDGAWDMLSGAITGFQEANR